MEKGRIVSVLLLVAVGMGLLLYGLLYNSTAVSSGSAAPAAVAGEPNFVPIAAQSEALSEPAVTEEVARGGITRDASGAIKKTYEGKEAPKACPTWVQWNAAVVSTAPGMSDSPNEVKDRG